MPNFKIFPGTYGQEICKRICNDGNILMTPGDITLKTFPDGERRLWYEEEVRGEEVFLIQPLINSDAIIELGLMVDAAQRSSARKVNIVCPYFAYARQERKDRSRSPISAKWLIDMLIFSGADRIITIDLNQPLILEIHQIPGYFFKFTHFPYISIPYISLTYNE